MNVGTAPLALRLTISAGVEGTPLNEVGHADTTIHLPLTATTEGTQVRVHVVTDRFGDTVQAIVDAASAVLQERHGITGAFDDPTEGALNAAACVDHHPVQHRDAKPPWCNACGMTEGRVHHDCFPGVTPKG